MQVSSGTKNNSSPNEPSCPTVTVSFNGVLLVTPLSHKTTVVVSTMHALYSRLIASDSELRNCQIPVLIRRCNSGATCAVTSTHITIILESLPKPGDDTLGDSKFFRILPAGYVHIPVVQ
ncbi:uncharacterized protein TNCV_2673251 [Trichonephila clavipes]|nr:uncharacterized protein TNCV_2673251 [Trichonephila clavipes]